MDQETQSNRGTSRNSSQVDAGLSDNSRNSVHEVELETVIMIDSEENACSITENRESGAKFDELGPSKSPVELETCETSGQIDQGSSGNSNSSLRQGVSETVIMMNSEEHASVSRENGVLEVKGSELGKVFVEKQQTNVREVGKESCVMDIKRDGGGGFDENLDGEKVCRICHLSSEQLSDYDGGGGGAIAAATTTDLIQLGCGCKDELGIAHRHCAEMWFKLKGNRLCEICGEGAKNITGVRDCAFLEEWNEHRFFDNGISLQRNRCWQGQPFCNFLMACLVIAFVLPWFFRVNMF